MLGSCRTTCARSLYVALVQDLAQDLCMRIVLDHLYQDPVGPLVQDLCIRVLWTACVRTLYDHLCKISVSGSCWTTVSGSGWTTCARSVLGSLCEDPLDHLYQDPAGALVQDPCYEDTCARSLYQDPVLCLRISVLGSTFGPLASRYCKRANSARLPRKLKIRSCKTSVLCETSSKTKAPDFQNERFVRDFLEN